MTLWYVFYSITCATFQILKQKETITKEKTMSIKKKKKNNVRFCYLIDKY